MWNVHVDCAVWIRVGSWFPSFGNVSLSVHERKDRQIQICRWHSYKKKRTLRRRMPALGRICLLSFFSRCLLHPRWARRWVVEENKKKKEREKEITSAKNAKTGRTPGVSTASRDVRDLQPCVLRSKVKIQPTFLTQKNLYRRHALQIPPVSLSLSLSIQRCSSLRVYVH